MITASAIINGDKDNILGFHKKENPLVLQLGGSNIDDMKRACLIAMEYEYDEININMGCPSNAVSSGMFGAFLMKDITHAANLTKSLIKTCKYKIPVTVKCRLGVDEFDSYEYFETFIKSLIDAGCSVFYVHARKAWLKGLSPKENRNIPPLKYDWVYKIKAQFPFVKIILNGGLQTFTDFNLMGNLDGVMLGRAVIQNPMILNELNKTKVSYQDVCLGYLDYVDSLKVQNINYYTKFMQGLMFSLPNARQFRQLVADKSVTTNKIRIFLSENA
jgi:tRNA-dihydrouridine synthase A